MKIWLDDVRNPPDDTWVWCKTTEHAFACILENNNKIEHVSFDHDLGHPKLDGYWLACQIETLVHSDSLLALSENEEIKKRIKSIKISKFSWDVHSANPVGRRNIELAMANVEKYWNKGI